MTGMFRGRAKEAGVTLGEQPQACGGGLSEGLARAALLWGGTGAEQVGGQSLLPLCDIPLGPPMAEPIQKKGQGERRAHGSRSRRPHPGPGAGRDQTRVAWSRQAQRR